FNGQAPVITFRAENDFKAEASLTDGFFQIANPVSPLSTIPVPAGSDFDTVNNEYNGDPAGGAYGYTFSFYAAPQYGLVGPANFTVTPGNAAEVAQYYGQYKAYLDYVGAATQNPFGVSSRFIDFAYLGTNTPIAGQPTLTVPAPTAAQEAADPGAWLVYFNDYQQVFAALVSKLLKNQPSSYLPPLQPPPAVLGPVIGTPTITFGTPALDNSPSPTAVANNPFPLLTASLQAGAGASSSYRIVAGANLSSANPSAVQSVAASSGSVTLNGHSTYQDSNGQAVYAPTMIRTGTGSIQIAAADDVSLLDSTAPGVIYTAGKPVDGAPIGDNSALLLGATLYGNAHDMFVTDAVNSDAGGAVSIQAGGDIVGQENLTTRGSTFSQFWWQWMQTGNIANLISGQITQTSINFAGFDQGVMSVGGNVSLIAGGDIVNMSASLPTTWYLTNNNQTVNTVGGGDLTVAAGGNVLSGSYFVANGIANITAGGQVASSGVALGASFGQNGT
ncbi:MAG TPA: hypothetical protein VGF36_17120, partial [Rhodopila sp.]